MHRQHLYSGCLGLLALMVITHAHATDSSTTNQSTQPSQKNGPPNGPPLGPPPEAIAACNGKTTGTEVSFTGKQGNTMKGVCEMIDGTLAARPTGMPSFNGGKPPSGVQ